MGDGESIVEESKSGYSHRSRGVEEGESVAESGRVSSTVGVCQQWVGSSSWLGSY